MNSPILPWKLYGICFVLKTAKLFSYCIIVIAKDILAVFIRNEWKVEAVMYKLRTPDARPGMPRFAVPAMLVLLLGIIVIIVLVILKQAYVNAWANSIQYAQATQEITFDQDIVIGTGDAILYLPKNTIRVAGTISILPLAPNSFPASGGVLWSRPQIVSVEYKNQLGTPVPHITFSNLAQICFTLTQEQWQDFDGHPDNYQVQYYDQQQDPPQWVALPAVTHPERFQLCGQTDHLSVFALAVRVVPPTPTIDATSTLVEVTLTATGTGTPFHTPKPRDNNEPANTQTKVPPTATSVPPPTNPPPTNPPPTPRPSVIPPGATSYP